jgi:Na+/H+ antiporter NhaA
VLVATAFVALVWMNVDSSSYDRIWSTVISISVGSHGISEDARYWINSGLMTFFFFVVGLEARREFDIGELRERRRVTLPLAAGAGGMALAVGIYLVANAGRPSAHGWGVAMSTDTALALGMLALVGPRFPDRLRAFMLTLSVADDLLALAVIAIVYTEDFAPEPLLVAVALLVAILGLRWLPLPHGLLKLVLGTATWVALYESGIDPVVSGLALGLVVYATPAARESLERATDLFRRFREQPTPELEREARLGLREALSPNERLQQLFHPWTSYVIVPLFALANAGVLINAEVLGRAFTSPITLGILIGFVVGKPVGIVGTSWLITTLTRGRLRPPVGWAALAGGGAIAGIPFTVSLLVANLAFEGEQLENAKLGLLGAGVLASTLTWLLFRATARLPRQLRIRALLGTSDAITDLDTPVDPERDHIRGPDDAPVTLVEYGDFECPYCGRAEPIVRELLSDFGDLRFVWRHLPLTDVHPRARAAAEAAEAAGEQGAFWEMHDLLLDHQDELRPPDLINYAEQLGLDIDKFRDDLEGHTGADHIDEDIDTADLSGVSGTPTFFVNGRRHYGAYDIDTLSSEVRIARARAAISP